MISIIIRKAFVSLLLIAVCLEATSIRVTADQIEKSWVGPKNCLVSPPAEWKGRTLGWEGACREGKAQGEGVLRGYKKGGDTLIFFGEMEKGELFLGVIENPEGYIAGQFNDGKLIPNSDRNTIIEAFRKATAAARNFSKQLKLKGNSKSSDFYQKKANELDQQMD
jgi:hypothetical protein